MISVIIKAKCLVIRRRLHRYVFAGSYLRAVHLELLHQAVKRVHFPEEGCAISFVSITIIPQPTLVFQDGFKQAEEYESDIIKMTEMEM